MIKLTKASRFVSASFNKVKINSKTLLNTKLALSDSAGIHLTWHVKYYDNLGDVFDVVNVNNEYALNRNDLVDFSNLNTNLFINTLAIKSKAVSSATSKATSSSLKGDSLEARASTSFKVSPIVLLANSNENSFSTKVVNSGRFIMELTPFASSLKQSRDYLGLHIETLSVDSESDYFGGLSRLEANIGDVICLSSINQANSDEDDLLRYV